MCIRDRTGAVWMDGDFNQDGHVGIADLGALADNYGKTSGATWRDGDFNRDGKVGIAGMVLLGGVVTATVAAIIYIRWKKLSLWKLADVIAPALALGIALGRIGCFANGCCYGQPTDAFCGVIFPDTSPAGSHFPDTPVLPTQLFSTTWNLILLAVMLFAERWKKFDGFPFALFLVGYSVFRIWVDTVRIYEPEEFIVHTETLRITVSQAISAGLIVFGVALFLVLRKKRTV